MPATESEIVIAAIEIITRDSSKLSMRAIARRLDYKSCHWRDVAEIGGIEGVEDLIVCRLLNSRRKYTKEQKYSIIKYLLRRCRYDLLNQIDEALNIFDDIKSLFEKLESVK